MNDATTSTISGTHFIRIVEPGRDPREINAFDLGDAQELAHGFIGTTRKNGGEVEIHRGMKADWRGSGPVEIVK